MAASWVNLLHSGEPRSPVRREVLKAAGGRVKVSEKTPHAKVGINQKKGSRTQVEVLRSQVVSLLKDKRELSQKVEEEQQRADTTERDLKNARVELEEALRMGSESRHHLEVQKGLLSQLSSEKSGLINQVETLWRGSPTRLPPTQSLSSHQHSLTNHNSSPRCEEVEVQLQGLRGALDEATLERQTLVTELGRQRERERRKLQGLEDQLKQKELANSYLEKTLQERTQQLEGLTAHLHDLRAEMALLSDHMAATGEHGHSNNVLLKDLERLSLRNAELSESLAATQHSRSVLEREALGLKRSLLEARTVKSQLEEALAQSARQKEAGEIRLQAVQDEARVRVAELQQQLDTAVTAKTEKVHELLAVSEDLQSTLSSLAVEKDQLAFSLRQEASYNQQLKASLKQQLHDSQEKQEATQAELRETREQLQTTQSELQGLQQVQVVEIEARCREIDGMKARLEEEVGGLQSERDSLASRLREAQEQLGEMRENQRHSEGEVEKLKAKTASLEGERVGLRAELSSLQAQLEEGGRVHDNLQRVTAELDHTLSELESARTTAMLQQQQGSDLEAQVQGLKEQLTSRAELTNEMKALLDQRAARIRQLERTVQRQRQDLSQLGCNTSNSGLLNASLGSNKDHSLEQTNSILLETASLHSNSSLPSPEHSLTSVTSPLRHPPSPVCYSSPAAEVLHLKQRLSESRQAGFKLEVRNASLKTQMARLQGSVQALGTIRDQLSKENHQLKECVRDLECERGAWEDERGGWERERADLKARLSKIEETAKNLSEEVMVLRGEREAWQELQEQLTSVENTCASREQDLAALEQVCRDVRGRLEGRETEVQHLQEELADMREHAHICQAETARLQQAVTTEAGTLREETSRFSRELSTLRAEAMEVRETSRITEAVNTARMGQIEEREARVAQLQAEVEVLRAKRAVVGGFLQQKEREGLGHTHRMQEDLQQLRTELQTTKVEGERCRLEVKRLSELLSEQECTLKDTQEQLTQVNREREQLAQVSREREQLAQVSRERQRGKQAHEREEPGQASGERRVVKVQSRRVGSRGPGRQSKVERLRRKLKLQIRQTNYLRLKLGYTLSELRLHKKLKLELDQRMTILQAGLHSTQEQYQHCLQRLQLAEQLGCSGSC